MMFHSHFQESSLGYNFYSCEIYDANIFSYDAIRLEQNKLFFVVRHTFDFIF